MDHFEDLPENDDLAFLALEREFRTKYEMETSENNNGWEYSARDYVNKTQATAVALSIGGLSPSITPKLKSENFHDEFWAFIREVDGVIIHIKISNSKRRRPMSVGLSAEQKAKLIGYIEKIRREVEKSDAVVGKKERIFEILGTLLVEIGKDRTRLEGFVDLSRTLAGVSKNFAEEGLEPWWKWVKAAFGIVDEAKQAEPMLPKPEEQKRIEAPRKELTKSSESRSDQTDDDEIPF